MSDITLGAGRQTFLFERSGEADTLLDFRSLYFEATLDEAQEVPPNDDIAEIDGRGVGVLNFGRDRFEFSLEINGINLEGGGAPDDLTDAHIHGAEVGATGPVIFDFRNDLETEVDGVAGAIAGGWDADEADALDMTPVHVAALRSEETYFNIHTNRDTSGFIRGQILRDGGAADRIDLTEFNVGGLASLRAITSDRGGDAVIRTWFGGDASSLRLDGVSTSGLRARHFIFAENEADMIDGTAERDDLFGAGGRDTLNGRGEKDRLFGENGRDTLSGGDGRDSLVGGLGLDVLTGGGGADRFLFNRSVETGETRRSADRITDFVADRDLLVLDGIDARAGATGDQDFVFIGGDAFDRSGQIRVTEVRGDTFVLLNTAGSEDAEAVIRLEGVVTLTADSFIL